jgi:hypothetical protein
MSNIYREWTVEVTQRIEDNKNKGAWIIDVEAVKGKRTEARNFHGIISQAMLTRAIKGWVDTMESASGVSETIDLTEPVKPEPEKPTRAELDKRAWEKDKALLVQLDELVKIGVFTGTEKPIADLQTKVRNGFKAEYLG